MTPEEIRKAVLKISTHPTGINKHRAMQLLAHCVEAKLAGNEHELHQKTIAVDVWKTPKGTGNVRQQKSILVDWLAEYYKSDGKDDPIRISFPKEGGFVPTFTRNERAILRSAPSTAGIPPMTERSERRVTVDVEDVDDVIVRVFRIPATQNTPARMSVEIIQRSEYVQPVVAADEDEAPGYAESQFTEIELNEVVVVLIEGVNPAGDSHYCYLELPLRRFIALGRKIRDEKPFVASNYGRILKAGFGELSDEAKREISEKHKLTDVPSLIPIPKRSV